MTPRTHDVTPRNHESEPEAMTTPSPALDAFENALQSLVGRPCWHVLAGAVGSLASLDVGAKVERDQPMPFRNKGIALEAHKYRGEFVLYIEDCPWRLDGPEAVIATWTDSNAPNGPIVQGLQRLAGQTITRVELTRPGLDLALHLADGHVLRIFPDQAIPMKATITPWTYTTALRISWGHAVS
ncbi:hypothetical protein HC928_16270 [bacterium]|nr:hypothetical protein [bacterium]